MKNQIDVTVSDADQNLVLQSIGSIKLAMPFLTKLSKAIVDELSKLFKQDSSTEAPVEAK